MKTTARQIAIDMYKCKDNRFENLDQLCQKLTDLVKDINFEISDCTAHKFDEDHLSVCIFFPEGSIVVHAYSQLDYVAADLYLCQENATPERYFNELKKLFKPEKIKTPQLKRGDFGTVKDMKPSTKTRIAPLRRISNTGTKVIRLLSRKN